MDQRHAVAEQLHRASLRLLRRLRQADESIQISAARLSALSVLVFDGPKSVGELARIEQVSQPAMTSLCQGLTRQGLVRARADPGDKRVRRLLATPKGKKMLFRAREKRIEMLTEMIAPLPPADLTVLARAADLIESALAEKKPAATGETPGR